jgi:hypothetical protein
MPASSLLHFPQTVLAFPNSYLCSGRNIVRTQSFVVLAAFDVAVNRLVQPFHHRCPMPLRQLYLPHFSNIKVKRESSIYQVRLRSSFCTCLLGCCDNQSQIVFELAVILCRFSSYRHLDSISRQPLPVTTTTSIGTWSFLSCS